MENIISRWNRKRPSAWKGKWMSNPFEFITTVFWDVSNRKVILSNWSEIYIDHTYFKKYFNNHTFRKILCKDWSGSLNGLLTK